MRLPIIVILFTTLTVSGQEFNQMVEDHFTGEYNLVGFCDLSAFEDPEYAEWFNEGYDEYDVSEEAAETLSKRTGEIDIIMVLGTWRPDSRREVPHFVKILNAIDFDEERLLIIGVDRDKALPEEMEFLEVEYVPTFIFLHNDEELGRIVESPSTTLEEDMAAILSSSE